MLKLRVALIILALLAGPSAPPIARAQTSPAEADLRRWLACADGAGDADAAARELLDIGPTATRAVREALAGSPTPQLKARCQAILDQVDASDYMK